MRVEFFLRSAHTADDCHTAQSQVLEELIKAEDRQIIRTIIGSVPDDLKQLYRYHFRDGLSVSKIAKTLGVSREKIKHKKRKLYRSRVSRVETAQI